MNVLTDDSGSFGAEISYINGAGFDSALSAKIRNMEGISENVPITIYKYRLQGGMTSYFTEITSTNCVAGYDKSSSEQWACGAKNLLNGASYWEPGKVNILVILTDTFAAGRECGGEDCATGSRLGCAGPGTSCHDIQNTCCFEGTEYHSQNAALLQQFRVAINSRKNLIGADNFIAMLGYTTELEGWAPSYPSYPTYSQQYVDYFYLKEDGYLQTLYSWTLGNTTSFFNNTGNTLAGALMGAYSSEVCDGCDNDCDGCIDGTKNWIIYPWWGYCVNSTKYCYTGPAGTDGVGLCHGFTQTCSSGSWSACNQVTPTAETLPCDGKDNDCDGLIDEDFAKKGYVNMCDNTDLCGNARYTYWGNGGVGRVNSCDLTLEDRCGTDSYTQIYNESPNIDNDCDGTICMPEICDVLDNDCDGTKDNGSGMECVKNVLYGQTDYREGDCTSQCKVCEDNRITSVTLTNLDDSSTSEAKNLDEAGSFKVDTTAISPNNCLTKYNYELLYSTDGSSWSKVSPGTGVGLSSFSADGSKTNVSCALADSFDFTMQYLPVGYKYKVGVQVVDAKDSKNVSGVSYADSAWKESNVITVANTVPIAIDISIPDRDVLSKNVFVNLMPSFDPDVFPYAGSQSLTYFARIWDDFNTPTNPAPDCTPSESKGNFGTVSGMSYSVPLIAQRTYCTDARVFDGLVYSSCSVSRCSDETPFDPNCADLGFNATVSSACVNPEGKTTVSINISCSKVKQVIDNKWFIGLGGVKIFDSSNFVQNVSGFTPLTDCTLEQKTITVIYDSNIDGAYTVDLNHGGIYNGKPLWCSTSKSFNANSKCGSENNLSIPDTSIILILPIIIIIIAILLQKEKRPLKKKK